MLIGFIGVILLGLILALNVPDVIKPFEVAPFIDDDVAHFDLSFRMKRLELLWFYDFIVGQPHIIVAPFVAELLSLVVAQLIIANVPRVPFRDYKVL